MTLRLIAAFLALGISAAQAQEPPKTITLEDCANVEVRMVHHYLSTGDRFTQTLVCHGEFGLDPRVASPPMLILQYGTSFGASVAPLSGLLLDQGHYDLDQPVGQH